MEWDAVLLNKKQSQSNGARSARAPNHGRLFPVPKLDEFPVN